MNLIIMWSAEFRVVNDEGANSWTPDGKGKDLRLIEKVPAVEMAVLIEIYDASTCFKVRKLCL